MDVSTFYALFSATCFTLLGLWWNVVQKHEAWLRSRAGRRDAGGIYLAFLLPALMGLFAQVGGTTNPNVWRASFVIVSVIGCVSTLRLLSSARSAAGDDADGAGIFARHRWISAGIYAVIALLGVAPEIVQPLGLTPLQAEAMLLILLVALAHWLVWEFMTNAPSPNPDPEPEPSPDPAP